VRRVPLVSWYVDLLARAARPRSVNAVERDGLAKFVLGSARPDSRAGNGWWYIRQAGMMWIAVAACAVAGLWWASVILLPFAAYFTAKSVGGFRERV
jgi:hypothetical protein